MKHPFLLALTVASILAAETSACTFFTKTLNGQTLVGNSEDYYEADTCAVFLPAEPSK